ERTFAAFDRIKEELAAQPGVTAVGSSAVSLLNGGGPGNGVTLAGTEAHPEQQVLSRRSEVSPDFFNTLAVPLVAGRNFTNADNATAPKVAIINQSLARKFN